MKRLKVGVINTLSFVKLGDFTTNSFDVTLEKVVGSDSLTITNLTDLNNLDPCKDFIRINIDLISNDIDGGEYILTLTNAGKSYSFLTEVKDYEVYQYDNGIYKDVVRFEPLEPTPLFLNTYQGAVVGYSLRQINAGYTGSAIQIRRASDNATQDIGFVDGELDTAAITTFCTGTNGYVSTWYDQSGNNNHATQVDTAKQPIIYNGSVITSDNNKPSVYFTGEQTLLNSGAASSFTGNFSVTILAVAENDETYFNASIQRSILTLKNSTNTLKLGFGYRKNNVGTSYAQKMFSTYSYTDYQGVQTQDYVNAAGLSELTKDSHLYYSDHTFGGTFARYINNDINVSQLGTAVITLTEDLGLDVLHLGALDNEFVAGHYMQECILYNVSKESTRTAMSTDLNTYYSLY